jgi:ABC-type amino acid transport system permease subunit
MTTQVQTDTKSRDSVASDPRRKRQMERVIETVASGLGNTIGALASSGVLFLVFAALWAAFAIALFWSQGSLDAAWQWVRSLPILLQGLVWLLFLPVTFGLWVWETTWPVILRLVVIGGVAFWNLLVFLPRAAQTAKP